MAREDASKQIRPWAATGDRTNPENRTPRLNRAVGWPVSFSTPGGDNPSRRVLNQMFFEITSMLHEINQHGVLEWDTQIEYIHPCAVIHTVGGRSQIYLSVADSTGVEPGGTASGSSWRTIETTAPLPIANEAEAWAAQRNDKTVTPEALGIYKRTQEEATRALARLLAAVNGNTNAIAAIPRLPASASPAEAAAAVIANKRVTPASLAVYKQRLDLAKRQVRDVDETFTLVGRNGIGRKNLFALFQDSQIGDSFSLAPDRLVFQRDVGVFRINIGEVQISTPKFSEVVNTLTVAKRQLTSNGQQDATFNVYNRTTGHAAHMRVNSYSV